MRRGGNGEEYNKNMSHEMVTPMVTIQNLLPSGNRSFEIAPTLMKSTAIKLTMTKPLLRRGDSKDGRSRSHHQNHTSLILIISSVLVSFYALIRCFDVVPDRQGMMGNSSSGGLSKPTLSSSSSATGQAVVVPGVLERLLIEAGMDQQSALSRSEILQLDEQIENLYGSNIVVAGSEDCISYRSTVPLDQRIVAVAGMFNTGTNLLDNQLRKNIMNLTQPNLWQVPWYVSLRLEVGCLFHCRFGQCCQNADRFYMQWPQHGRCCL
jgi:hypothetical protein